MSLIKFNRKGFPWSDSIFDSLLDPADFKDFFNGKDNLPAMNVKETSNEYQIELAVPGFTKEDIEVTVVDSRLNIVAQKSKKEVEENQEGYTRKEFNYNRFSRSVQLPANVDGDNEIKATYENGILALKIQKSEELEAASKKTIEIA